MFTRSCVDAINGALNQIETNAQHAGLKRLVNLIGFEKKICLRDSDRDRNMAKKTTAAINRFLNLVMMLPVKDQAQLFGLIDQSRARLGLKEEFPVYNSLRGIYIMCNVIFTT